MNITRNDGTAIQLSDDIAPSYSCVDSMYRALEFRMGGLTVSRIGQYCPQISALKKRQDYSTQWRNGLGQSIGMYNTDFIERQNYISADGTSGRDYWKDDQYFGGVVSQVWVNETSELTAGEIKLVATTAILTFGTILVGDRIKYGIAPNQQLLEVVGIAEEKADHKLNRYTVRPVSGVIVPVGPGDMKTGSIYQVVRVRGIQPPTARTGNFEFMWQPCLSIFDSEKALPVGSYSFLLQPESRGVIEKNVIQSLGLNKTAGVDYKLNITDVRFYVSTVESARVDDLDYFIDLKEIQCAPAKVIQASWSQFQFITIIDCRNGSISG